MAGLELLLMGHGAGIKPGQDPKKEPRGPDGVLTAAGYLDAQAVGHYLAETLTSSFPDGCQVAVLYALPTSHLAEGKERGGWRRLGRKPGLSSSGEPEATAKVLARYLAEAGIRLTGPERWSARLPSPFLALTDESRRLLK